MGFPRQEDWSGLPSPPPGNLPHLGIEFTSLMSPALAGIFFTTNATWEAWNRISVSKVWRLENNIGKLKKKQKNTKKNHTFFLSLPSTPNHKYLCVCAGLSRFICVRLCATLWTIASKALLSIGFSRQYTGASCHSLLQGIFQTQGSNQGLLHCGRTLYHSHWRSHKYLDPSNSSPACFLSFFTYDNNISFYCTSESLKSFYIILFSLQSILPVQ